jgi:acetyl esterase/lipase
VTTTWWGPDAPAYYEIGGPTGIFAGQRPRGLMMIIHGGGWFHVGAADVAASRAQANRWRERGWSTVNIDYRACAQSIPDVLWFYDTARRIAGGLPVCANGLSAGGHLALMIAVLRPELDCVIAQGAPTDLVSIVAQTAFDPPTGGQQLVGPSRMFHWGAAAFGVDALTTNSPALSRIEARVLAATSAADHFVPFAQATELADAMRADDPAAYVDVMQLAAGTERFTHGSVSRSAMETFWQHEAQLVAPLVASGPTYASPIRVGTTTNGSMQLGTTVTTTTVVATVGSTPLSIDRGGVYRVQTCAGWFGGAAPAQTCLTTPIDTTSATGPTIVQAPPVTATFNRSRMVANLAMGLVTVTRQDAGGNWVRVATSWPSIGLPGAGVTIPPAV